MMEWDSDTRRPIPPDSVWYWDAINTPEGVAGYCYAAGDSQFCPQWYFNFLPSVQQMYHPLVMALDLNDTTAQWYSVHTEQEGDSIHITAEWLLSWDTLCTDSTAHYHFGLLGFSSCADTLEPLLIEGERTINRSAGSTLVFQFISILLLAFLFIYLKIKSRKPIRRTVSPHR
jgi:hypothetical protein